MSLITNRKASLKYEILQKYVAGIELFGHEVKSLRASQGSLDGARVSVQEGEAFVINMTIPPYQEGNTPKDYDPARPRRLLLNKQEISDFATAESSKGLTIIPLSVYNKGKVLKLDIAIVRGKKKYDKRETIKRHDTERDIKREFSDK